MKISEKILACLFLLSQVMVAGPGKDKVPFVFKKFEQPYPEHNPERISSFSSEELRSKHQTLPSEHPSYLFRPNNVKPYDTDASQFLNPEQTVKTFPSEFTANKAKEMLMENTKSNQHDGWSGEFDAYGNNFGALPYGSLGTFPFRSSNEPSSALILTAVIASGNPRMDAAAQHVVEQINNNTPTEVDVD